MAKKLDQYKGKLTNSQIAEGMNSARNNAKRLIRDAEILFENGRFPSALSLAILSIEEAGKLSILRQLALAKNEEEIKSSWKDYRSHQKKNVAWISVDMIKNGARKLDDFESIYDKDSDHPNVLDQLKQVGFYTDCLGNAHWSYPESVIDHELAKGIVDIAKILAGNGHHTARELELWQEHVAPVYKLSRCQMKGGIKAWFDAMVAEGLLEEKETKFTDFLGSQ